MPSFEFLGPYRIGEPLGRGGMGSVYSAVHEKTGERVAVKLIAQAVADEPKFRRRFDAEIETLQRLRHPGIVRPIGIGEEAGQLFYSMELVEGESLQSRIRREKRLDWRPTLDFSIQICAALKHAHDIGVIHRDLKPANLMLTNDEQVKLVDFGIAKIFGDGEQTMPGSVLGTADYMAPEQAMSTGITARTDLYALGNVMYAMLTGRPPFSGKRVTEVIESVKRDRPVPLDLVNPELPEALVELVHQLLAKEPGERPPTALAVMNRLKAMRAGLQREQTVMGDGSPTAVGLADPDSFDTDDVGSDDSSVTQVSNDRRPVPRKKTLVSKGSDRPKPIDPHGATIVSGSAGKTRLPDGSVADDEEDRRNTNTHFQTVTDSHPSSGIFRDSKPEVEPAWTQWLTIVAMIGVLAIGGGLFIYAMQPPTADQLFEQASSGDRAAMITFPQRFPEDPRRTEVYNMLMAHRLNAVLKRLSIQAKLGITPLEAAEEGFVDAMTGREQEPIQCMERLEHWLNVYGDPVNELDPQLKELIELAKHEITQLAIRAPEIIIDSRATKLIKEIRESVKSDEPEVLRKKLNGIIEIHERRSWAKPAVDEAREQLRALEASGDDDMSPSGGEPSVDSEEPSAETSPNPSP